MQIVCLSPSKKRKNIHVIRSLIYLWTTEMCKETLFFSITALDFFKHPTQWVAAGEESEEYPDIVISIVLVTQSYDFLQSPWTVTYQSPLSMGFSRHEYYSGLPFPSLGGLPNPGIKPSSPALQADSLLTEPLSP